jgi:hypothetical protein
LIDLVEIAKPRQELRLVNRYAHAVPRLSACCNPALSDGSEANGQSLGFVCV